MFSRFYNFIFRLLPDFKSYVLVPCANCSSIDAFLAAKKAGLDPLVAVPSCSSCQAVRTLTLSK